MSRIPTHRISEHPGALLREQIEETGESEVLAA